MQRKEKEDLEIEILKILLTPPYEYDVSVRQIAKKLDRPVSHIHYYLKKMTAQGILIREGTRESGLYMPQKIFDCNVETTKKHLRKIAEEIETPTNIKLANCIRLFLELNSL